MRTSWVFWLYNLDQGFGRMIHLKVLIEAVGLLHSSEVVESNGCGCLVGLILYNHRQIMLICVCLWTLGTFLSGSWEWGKSLEVALLDQTGVSGRKRCPSAQCLDYVWFMCSFFFFLCSFWANSSTDSCSVTFESKPKQIIAHFDYSIMHFYYFY